MDKRKLSSSEQKRSERFALVCQRMETNGYTRENLTIGIVRANIFAILFMLPFAAISLVLFFVIGFKGSFSFTLTDLLVFYVMLVVITVTHEFIHGLTWALFAKNHFQSIEFGFITKYLTPYCTCSEPLTKSQYIIGGAMPTIILGFGLSAISIVLGSFVLQILAVVMIFGGGGDVLIIIKLLRYKNSGKTAVFYDHPYECGLVAFVKNLK